MALKDEFKPGKVECYALIGLRRRIGELVFRKLKSGWYASRRPKKPAYQTEGTKLGMQRFRNASRFARQEILDPEKKAHYQAIAERSRPHMRSAYAAAVQAYMNDPLTKIKPPDEVETKPIEKSHLNQRSVNAPRRMVRYCLPIPRRVRLPMLNRVPSIHFKSADNRSPTNFATSTFRRFAHRCDSS